MPLFGNKFSPKKSSPRKGQTLSNLKLDPGSVDREFGLDLGPVQVRLGQHEITFEDGQWSSESGGGASTKDNVKLKKQNQQLTEENNLLKVKIDILLDMLSEQTAEGHLMENEIENLKAMLKSGGKKK